MKIEERVLEATKGNRRALEGIAVAIQDDIYYLALRMLANPEDAKEATQEILIKVMTNLSSFRFESQFKTWVYRLAVNYLISERKILAKELGLTFEIYKKDLESDLQDSNELRNNPEYLVLLNEMRVSCTIAMLLCLTPTHRIAYILGDILEMEHAEASDILAISKANFRKQLSRARAKVVDFTSKNCGLVSLKSACRCDKKLKGAISRKRINLDHIIFANNQEYSYKEIKQSIQETKEDLKSLALQTSIQRYKSPIQLGAIIESIVDEGLATNNKHN